MLCCLLRTFKNYCKMFKTVIAWRKNMKQIMYTSCLLNHPLYVGLVQFSTHQGWVVASCVQTSLGILFRLGLALSEINITIRHTVWKDEWHLFWNYAKLENCLFVSSTVRIQQCDLWFQIHPLSIIISLSGAPRVSCIVTISCVQT